MQFSKFQAKILKRGMRRGYILRIPPENSSLRQDILYLQKNNYVDLRGAVNENGFIVAWHVATTAGGRAAYYERGVTSRRFAITTTLAIIGAATGLASLLWLVLSTLLQLK